MPLSTLSIAIALSDGPLRLNCRGVEHGKRVHQELKGFERQGALRVAADAPGRAVAREVAHAV